jgi:hypothetical protein
MRRVGDRRARARLDVVGALWGTLETRRRAEIVDLSDTGALVLTPGLLTPNRVHTLEISHEGRQLATQMLFRRVRPAPAHGSYHPGVELLSAPLVAP